MSFLWSLISCSKHIGNSKTNDQLNENYIDFIIIEAPSKYDLLSGILLDKDKFNFIRRKLQNWLFKKELSNIKNESGLGFITNKSSKHILEIEFHTVN